MSSAVGKRRFLFQRGGNSLDTPTDRRVRSDVATGISWLEVNPAAVRTDGGPGSGLLHSPYPHQEPARFDDAHGAHQHFQLNVFREQCGNRGKPIVYGLPTSVDPSYLAIGGYIIEENHPRYACSCGHEWTDDDVSGGGDHVR